MIKAKALLKVAKVFSITGKYLLLSQKSNPNTTSIKNRWSKEIFHLFKIDIEIKGQPAVLNESSILLGNHISYLDIPILLRSCPDITFVSKKEVKYWPIIGSAATKMQTIFVERKNPDSRAQAKLKIADSLLTKKQRLVIFPSGTTSIRASARWQQGVFEIAEKNKIKIQPFRIHYCPLRAAAYIDNDNLILHMYNLFKLKKIKVILEFHEPVSVHSSISGCEHWKKWCEENHLH